MRTISVIAIVAVEVINRPSHVGLRRHFFFRDDFALRRRHGPTRPRIVRWDAAANFLGTALILLKSGLILGISARRLLKGARILRESLVLWRVP